MSAFKLRRLGYALGAEVQGLDLSRPLDDRTVADLRRAWLDNIVLCFPQQDLSPEEFRTFAGRFGELDDNRAGPHIRHPDDASVMVLVNKQTSIKDKVYSGILSEFWHTDFSHTDRPGSAAFLAARKLPEIGGDTMFANTYLAYETLSPALQRALESLEGVHDVTFGPLFRTYSPQLQAERRSVSKPYAHPIVRTHSETGRRFLYIGARVRNFVGMTEEESGPLLDFLNEHATRYEFIYRHRWRVHDVVMWDNRCSLHYAVQDYDHSQLREMMRCSVLAPKSGYAYAMAEQAVESA